MKLLIILIATVLLSVSCKTQEATKGKRLVIEKDGM